MNITLDFSSNKSVTNVTTQQELAVMSASLAKKLLKMYAEQLGGYASSTTIINKHIEELRACENVDKAITVSIDFISERELINNAAGGQWDAYKVEPEAIV